MPDHPRAIYETYRAQGEMSPFDALREMQKEADAVLEWAKARMTVVTVGQLGHVQPDTNIGDARLRMICDETDGWHETFLDAALTDVRDDIASSGESFAWIVARNPADSRLRTRYKGYIVAVEGGLVTFFDDTTVVLDLITEVAR